MASDVSDIRDLDELEVYGSETQASIQLMSYTFEVRTTKYSHFYKFYGFRNFFVKLLIK